MNLSLITILNIIGGSAAVQTLGILLLMAVTWFARDIYNFLMSLRKIRNEWPSIKGRLASAESAVEGIQRSLRDIRASMANRYSSTNSPQSLNEAGKRAAEAIDALSIARKYVGYVQIGEGASAYDIQQACFDFALRDLPNKLTDEEKKIIKDFAYRDGTAEETILRTVVGITMRDRMLEDRGLAPDRVDSNDPDR